PVLAGDDLGADAAFVLGLVSQHRAADHVADGVDAGHARAELVVDVDAAALVELHASLLQSESLGVRTAADGEQDDVAFDDLGLAALGRLDRDRGALVGSLRAGDLHAGADLEALLAEQPVHHLRDLA